ncbi:MAG: alpha/beta hydrolase [Planctomycetota bacterium]|nr:alpha/beta hydrolase [Planctomycetota bacterium]
MNVVSHEVPGVGRVEAMVPAQTYDTDPNLPAVVYVPGLGMDAQSWLRQLPLAALAGFHAVRPPARPAAGEEGLGHFARYYEGYIEAAGLNRRPGGVVLVGSSMGGAVSLLMTLRGRIHQRGLVLAGTFGSCKYLNRFQRFAWPLSWVLPELVVRRFAKPMLRESDTFGRFTDEEVDYMIRCITIPSRGYFVRAARALTRLKLVDEAHKVGVPTLVLHGTEDRVLPVEAGRELARIIPGARMASFEKAGHAFFFTHHEAVNAAIANFLSGLRAAKPAARNATPSIARAQSLIA